ncbi:uncharacterized protein CELE_F48C1.8 [Caenorhabditis elegans]|uniref:Uncharacterized protein n=1 Tax=Caenorhabditis elegans TaxID=6239 RepID=O01575_CAEEL|nr:Uncharacterized protein CELE_F48C1.8 [Caenorhabditis elegans]CCD62477.1 Uncharacterized protein CELE_F48C1.8 [Caenorhabditis elegans]|eukprot:NP_491570.2 Uncharacterized protein CELE_F48C1.8 [Caenorhabditis elegans]
MNQNFIFLLIFLIFVEVAARGGDHGGGDHGGHDHGGHDHGGHDHGGHDHGGWGGHDHHDHHHGGWGGHDHDHGNGGGGGDNGWGYRPFTGFGGRNYYGGGGGGLLSRLFGWRRRGYNNGYYGYPNYGYTCRVSQFVDYVGRVPRFYCDCPPYPPNYQWNQCSPMYSG